MNRKLFVLAFIVFTFVSARCTAPATPSAQQRAGDGTSGIKGTTRSVVVSGVPGGATIGGPASIEFAIAPVQAGKPVYDNAIMVRSNADGTFKVALSPGAYWIGPKEKALDPTRYQPGPTEFLEMVVDVTAGTFVTVELVLTGFAP